MPLSYDIKNDSVKKKSKHIYIRYPLIYLFNVNLKDKLIGKITLIYPKI